MVKEILATLLFSFSTSTNAIKTTPYKAYVQKVSGIYNFKNNFEWTNLSNLNGTTEKQIVFDNTWELPEEERVGKLYDMMRYNNKNYFLEKLTIRAVWNDESNRYTNLNVTFNYYDLYANRSSFGVYLLQNNTIENIQTAKAKVYFFVREPIMIDEESSILFNTLFTQEENLFIKNYTGWYNFNNTITSFSNKPAMYGTITIGNKMYYSVCPNEVTSTEVQVGVFDTSNNYYKFEYLKLPFSSYGISNQWYLTAKMTEDDYTIWSQNGTFGYIPQVQPDEYNFSDLFFSLADTPIYFVYSIFNWELFGANLFIAFIGLISFALVLLLFRRFL